MSDDRVFLTFDVLPDGIEAWHASYAAVCKFLTANADTYGLPSQLDDCSDEQKEMLLDVCSADPAFADIPPRTDCPPAISAGSLVIELFTKTVPKTAANFAQLCTGEKGVGKAGKPLYYKGCNVHRIAPGFCIQAGDIVKGDGSAGDSIYGGKFNDEKAGLKLKHDARGLLSMANSGKNSNTSQFFITLDKAPKLDGKHVPFGRVTSDSMHVLTKLEAAAADTDGPPKHRVVISDCGRA